tara:strand:- start:5367 stop:5690 length:324 start_codon:yes stop_codon:yes gene_type:complete
MSFPPQQGITGADPGMMMGGGVPPVPEGQPPNPQAQIRGALNLPETAQIQPQHMDQLMKQNIIVMMGGKLSEEQQDAVRNMLSIPDGGAITDEHINVLKQVGRLIVG